MKNKQFYSTLFLAFFYCQLSYAQSCIPVGAGLSNQSEIDNFVNDYPGCVEVKGHLVIMENSSGQIRNLEGLSHITHFGEDLAIVANDSLKDLSPIKNMKGTKGIQFHYCLSLTHLPSFDSLSSIDGTLRVANNPRLENLMGLGNIERIDDYFLVDENDLLVNMQGMEQLRTIGQDLSITEMLALESLDGLENLEIIDGEIIIQENAVLNSLEAIGDVNSFSINHLTIEDNPSLSVCHEPAICNFLAHGGTAVINNNKTGCNSLEEVIEACGIIVSLEELTLPETLLFPNPTFGKFQVKGNLGEGGRLSIIDPMGHVLLETEWQKQVEVDLSNSPKGIYFVNIELGARVHSMRLVKL